MHTSYYTKVRNNPNAVSIAGYPPKWFIGRQYTKLAPKPWFFRQYKEDNDKEAYTRHYYSEVLDHLDPHQVYQELGLDTILVCWEKGESGVPYDQQKEFCHRGLVAQWLMKHLDVKITEL